MLVGSSPRQLKRAGVELKPRAVGASGRTVRSADGSGVDVDALDLWWVVAAIAAHGVSDSIHLRLIENPGVPAWWPAFCLAIDVCLAAWLAALLLRGDLRARGSRYDARLDS